MKDGPPISAATIRRYWNDPAFTRRAAAAALGLSVNGFSNRAAALALPQRRTGGRNVAEFVAFKAKWLAGVKAVDLAKEIGCNADRVRAVAKRLRLSALPAHSHSGLICLADYRRRVLLDRLAEVARLEDGAVKAAAWVDGINLKSGRRPAP